MSEWIKICKYNYKKNCIMSEDNYKCFDNVKSE